MTKEAQPAAPGTARAPEVLPPHERQVIVQEVVREVAEYFSGPLPPPDMLGAYDKLCPGLADRIVKMAEDQSHHRQALESSALGHNQTLAGRGQIMGFVLALVMLGGGIYLASQGLEVSGLSIVAAAVGSLLGVAWYGKRSSLADLRKKAKAMEREPQLPLPPDKGQR